MAKGVITCDWLKRPLAEDEECIEVTVARFNIPPGQEPPEEKEYTFSPEGYEAFISYLDGVQTNQAQIQAPPNIDTSRALLPGDQKRLPVPTPERVQEVLESSKIAEEGTLGVLTDPVARKNAAKKLKAIEERNKSERERRAREAGSEYYREFK